MPFFLVIVIVIVNYPTLMMMMMKVKSYWKWNLNGMNEPACRTYRAAILHTFPHSRPSPKFIYLLIIKSYTEYNTNSKQKKQKRTQKNTKDNTKKKQNYKNIKNIYKHTWTFNPKTKPNTDPIAADATSVDQWPWQRYVLYLMSFWLSSSSSS